MNKSAVRRSVYFALTAAIVIFGTNDMAAAAAMLGLYIFAVVFKDSSCRNAAMAVPAVCMAAVTAGVCAAALLNHSDVYDTCMVCIKLSAFIFPFVSVSRDEAPCMVKYVHAAVTAAACISLIHYALSAAGGFAEPKMRSIVGYSNTASVLFGVGVWLSVYYAKQKHDCLYTVSGLINAAAAAAALSRLGTVCFIFSVTVYFAARHKRIRKYMAVTFILLLFAALWLILSGQYREYLGTTMASRIDCWKDTAAVLIKKPFGIGPGTWKELQYSIQSADYSVFMVHNSFLQTALDGGIAALAGFLLMLVYIIVHSRQNAVSAACISLIIAHSFADMDFYYICILFVLGVIMRCGAEEQRRCPGIVYVYIVIVLCSLIGVSFYEPAAESSLQKINRSYQAAYVKNDADAMCRYAEQWLNEAPKQKAAYESYKTAVKKMYDNNSDVPANIWKLNVNGIDITGQNPPVELEGYIMLPAENIAGALNYSVDYSSARQEMEFKNNSGADKFLLKAENKIAVSGGALKHVISDVFIIGDRLMVSADKLKEYFCVDVDGSERVIRVNHKQGQTKPYTH